MHFYTTLHVLFIFFVLLDLTYQDHDDFKREIREKIEGNLHAENTRNFHSPLSDGRSKDDRDIF
jgi:hypothetical protein